MSRAVPRTRLLLVEPDSLMRRIVSAVVRELDLADIEEATGPQTATTKLQSRPFDGLVLALDDAGEMLSLLQDLRASRYSTRAEAPVVVMANGCDDGMIGTMRELGVHRLLLKPFKVKTVLDSVVAICSPAPAPPGTSRL